MHTDGACDVCTGQHAAATVPGMMDTRVHRVVHHAHDGWHIVVGQSSYRDTNAHEMSGAALAYNTHRDGHIVSVHNLVEQVCEYVHTASRCRTLWDVY